MGFEVYQEAGASVRDDISSLVHQIPKQDIEKFTNEIKEKLNCGGCFSVLPDIELEDDMPSFSRDRADKCIPDFFRRPDGDDTWGGIRERFFGPNYDDLARKVDRAAQREALSKLSPEERKKYEEEKAALDDYYDRHFSRMCLIDVHEKPPHTPTLDKVNREASQIEQAARKEVLEHLTPEERIKYEEEKRKYDEASRFSWDKDDLMMCIYRPLPQAGPMMKEVERRTASVIRSHSYGEYHEIPVCKTL